MRISNETMAERRHNRKMAPSFAQRLLGWYDGNARAMPWRVRPPERPDPYCVWLSEIMLQQTTVAAVRDYYVTFISRWPDVHALAAAPLDDILKVWAGLGYYARARNLHACANMVVKRHGGRFPNDLGELQALPGIGLYTAAAIAAIAFDQPHAAVDGNVERVISRYFAIDKPLPQSKPEIRSRAQSLVPQARAGDFAQALMDLGATLCTPKSPSCDICPCTEDCIGRKRGIAATLPRRLAKQAIPTRKGLAYWVEREDGAVLLRRRPEKGLLGGMIEVPSSQWRARLPQRPATEAPVRAIWKKLPGLVRHTFTHFRLELVVVKAVAGKNGKLLGGGDYRWVKPRDLPDEALPSVMRKVVAHVLGEG